MTEEKITKKYLLGRHTTDAYFVACEHIHWCRRNNYSPSRVWRDFGMIPPLYKRATWRDAIALVAREWDKLEIRTCAT